MALWSRPSCLYTPNAKSIGVPHHYILCGTGDQIQGLGNASQRLYQMNYIPNPTFLLPFPPFIFVFFSFQLLCRGSSPCLSFSFVLACPGLSPFTQFPPHTCWRLGLEGLMLTLERSEQQSRRGDSNEKVLKACSGLDFILYTSHVHLHLILYIT